MNWIKLRQGNGGELLCSAGNMPFVEVDLRPCFPLARPGEYLTMIDKNGREVAMVESPMGLDLESRRALDSAMGAAGFIIVVTAVRSLESHGDLVVWEIDSAQGSRTIQTTAGEWPTPQDSGVSLLEDVSGDLYLIPPLASLDPKSRRLLESMVG